MLTCFAVAPSWTLGVVFPFNAQAVNDLQWYFFHCRRRTDWAVPPNNSADSLKARFRQCATAFPAFAQRVLPRASDL